ncbi:MAG TPA: 3-dehydroquinate synthase [Thermoanaerobaculia bacterium]|nr:3-dehydroquinate synthase [Thermoanaerobaculia bacterium]
MPAPIELALRHPGGTCPILVGRGLLGAALEPLSSVVAGRTVFLVSSPPVRGRHGAAAAASLAAAARIVELDAADGEGAKTVAEAEKLWSAMVEAGGKRDSVLVALGGGSVGDLGGFVAATFLRGIRWVQVPTTLLAQVDASVGGKTGIDLPGAKNSVGAFHQPELVVADVDTLSTLDAGERRAGLFEMVKMAALLDPAELDRLEQRLDALLAGDPETLVPAVAAAVAAKIAVVEADPFEGDRRRLLNFGHTLAHALETVLAYGGLRHGEAVGYGMLFALELGRERGLPEEDAKRLRSLIWRMGLPKLPELSPQRIWEVLGRDKKAREEGLSWVLPLAIGRAEITSDVPAGRVRELLRDFLERR